MAYCTVNGATVLGGTINLPKVGVWTADVELPAPAGVKTLSGRATLQLGPAITLVGSYARTGLDGRGRLRARLSGGAGGLGKTLAPRSYLGVPMRIPLQDILTDAGETLSATADAAALAFQMPAWSRMSSVAGVSLAALVTAVGASWRMLPTARSGSGPRRMARVDDAGGRDLVRARGEAPHRRIALAHRAPRPDFDGDRIAFVQHIVTSRDLRTVMQLE
jgi:hypothetical protein